MTLSRRASLVALTIIAALAPVTSRASTNTPQLTSRFPEIETSIQSQDSGEIFASYDRDLDGGSGFRLEDRTATPVAGTGYLTGPSSGTTGYRTVAFRPAAFLSETGSPYTATSRACPLVTKNQCSTDVWTFIVDDTAPATPTVTRPLDGDVRHEQKIEVRGAAEAGARVAVVENEQTIATGRADETGVYSVLLPYPDEDGVHHVIAVHAIDAARNVSQSSPAVGFWHDDVTILPFITQPLEGEQIASTSVAVGGTAKAGATVSLYEGMTLLSTIPVDPHGHWSAPFIFAEGAHSLVAYSWDGMTTDGPSNTRSFVVDITAPLAPVITFPAAGGMVNTHDVTVAGTSEAYATITVRENGGGIIGTANASAAGVWTTTIDFSEGVHTIDATATDRAGNTGPSSAPLSFTVDTTPPPAPVITAPEPGSQINSTNVAITGHAETGASVQIIERGTILGTTTAVAGNFSVPLTFMDGLHAITAIAVDPAGNPSAPSKTLTFTIDTTPPGVPIINSPPEGGQYVTSSVFIAGTAESDVRIEIKEGATTLRMTAADGNGNWAESVVFPNGSHTINVRALDFAGNASAFTPDRHFLVGAAFDNTAPPAPVIDAPEEASLNPGLVVFSGTAEPGATVRMFSGAFSLASGTADGGGGWEFAASMNSGTYTVRATATDTSQNTSVLSDPVTFRVDANRPKVTIDGSSPSIIIPISGCVAPCSFEITGTASDDYGVTRVELEYNDKITGTNKLTEIATCTGCPNAPVTWSASPSALTPGLYDVSAYAVDVVGNRSAPATIVVLLL